MCCLSWLSALFDYLGWHSSDAPSQPLSQELQRRNITSEDHGYQATTLMRQPSTVAVKQGRIGLAKCQSYLDPFDQKSRDQLTYQRLESRQRLPPPSDEPVEQMITVHNFSREDHFTRDVMKMKGATVEMKLRENGKLVDWRRVYVEELFLIQGGMQALESFLDRGLSEAEIRQVYGSILEHVSLHDLWKLIVVQRSKGNLDSLLNKKVRE